MKRIIPLFSIIILYSLASAGQDKKYEYYFDEKLNRVNESNALFTGTATKEQDLLSLQIVDKMTRQTVVLAHYTDSSLTVTQGSYQSFFSNGIKGAEGIYESNKQHGLWKKWNNKGKLLDSTFYDNGTKISSATFSYNRNGSYTYQFEDLKNDRMQEVSYNDSGKVSSEVTFIGGSGTIKTYTKNGVQIDSLLSRESRGASFPGGDGAWAKYIKEKIVKKLDDLMRDGQSGTCRVRFMVDKEGNVSDVQVLSMKGSLLASVAIDAVLKGPKWNPAIKYGKLVNAYREQPVTFTIQKG
jgi:TonB family protein